MNGLRGFALLLVLQLAGELLARAFGLALPGPVLGLALLLPLLALEPLRTWVAAAADALLAHLSLLFVPIGVGVVLHLGLLATYGWQLALVLAVSTALGLGVSALVMRWAWRDEAPGEAGPPA